MLKTLPLLLMKKIQDLMLMILAIPEQLKNKLMLLMYRLPPLLLWFQ